MFVLCDACVDVRDSNGAVTGIGKTFRSQQCHGLGDMLVLVLLFIIADIPE